MRTYGVIMAGGGGTRFWPLSRRQTPKQLLNLSGKNVMVAEAAERLALVTDPNDVFIVTNIAQKAKIQSATAGKIKGDHILAEPASRNTAACIGYAAVEIIQKYGDGIMAITPSDAYIKDNDEFARVLRVAISEAECTDKLVTIGITPTFPATGYGYIKFGQAEGEVKPVIRFVEKPDEDTAKAYIKSGNFVWNSGMFVWKASVILQKFRRYLPEVYSLLLELKKAIAADNYGMIEKVYSAIPAVSIDYGIMEKCNDILVVPAEFGWNDVGSWDTYSVLHKEDGDGNIKTGDVIMLDSKNTTVYSSGRLVAVVGADNLVVVETPDAVLVLPKDRAQDVKNIVDKLKKDGREELL